MAKKILLIEDDFAIIDIYKTVLSANNFELETIIWGKEALEKIEKIRSKKENKPDLVLLDLILPDMNGIEILKKIKEQEETSNLPVFVLTNYNSQEMEQEAKRLKAEKFIIKTECTPTDLIGVIKKRFKI